MPAKKYDKGSIIGPLCLEILERVGSKKVHIICPNCGNDQWYPNISDVVSGKSTNCGCKRRQQTIERNKENYKDIRNKQYGHLIALEPTDKRQNTYVVWKCLCTLCGGLHEANVHDLEKGSVQSCGCWTGSVGEETIREQLQKYNILYERQKTFVDCINPETGHLLYFDFYLPDYNCCIEYDGIQHFIPVDFFGGKKGFQERCFKDSIKNEYCNKKNIHLIRISYKELNDLDIIRKMKEEDNNKK